MKAVVIEQFGGADVLRLGDIPRPAQGDEEVLVRVAYAGVNPVDWKIREGYLKDLFPHDFPITLGCDMAGTVEAVGQQVRRFKPGDRVFACYFRPQMKHGTYAEFIAIEESAVAPVPSNLNFAQGAAIPLSSLTAWQALADFADLRSGESVLIRGGAGGVGSMAIQIARHLGAKVYTTASTRNHDYVRSLGAAVAIDYATEASIDAVRCSEPSGVDVVFDCTGSDDFRENFLAVRRGGRVASIAGRPDLIPALLALGEKFGVRSGMVFVRADGEQLARIAGLIERGAIVPPHVDAVALEDVAHAHDRSQAGHVRGKIVLKIA